MKLSIGAAFAASLVFAAPLAGSAVAQGLQPSGTRAGGPGQLGAPGELMPEQRTWVRGYVMARPGPVMAIEEDIEPGWVVPPTVVLTPFPRDTYRTFPGARRYSYFRTGEEVVLVDPRTRRVVAVIGD